MEIKLFSNNSDNRKVNKTLTNETTLSGELKDILPLTDLSFTFDFSTIANYNVLNYALINGIYYFVTNKNIINNNFIELTLHIDVLMSYKSKFLNLDCIVKRNEEKFNTYFHDNELSQLSYKPIQTKLFSNSNVFEGYSFLLTTV